MDCWLLHPDIVNQTFSPVHQSPAGSAQRPMRPCTLQHPQVNKGLGHAHPQVRAQLKPQVLVS